MSFLSQVTQTIAGIKHINYIEEFQPNLTLEEKRSKKRFLIYRSNPGNAEDQPKFVSYYLDLTGCNMYLGRTDQNQE
jgi:hypothetical protein